MYEYLDGDGYKPAGFGTTYCAFTSPYFRKFLSMDVPPLMPSPLLAVLAIIAAFGLGWPATGAQAGSFTNGIWKADACGDEPVAPVLHAESSSAYQESIQWVKLYEQQINVYNACLVKEANADVAAVNETVRASQHRANDAFNQYNAASKQMSGQSDDSGTPHSGHRGQQGGFSIGSGGGD